MVHKNDVIKLVYPEICLHILTKRGAQVARKTAHLDKTVEHSVFVIGRQTTINTYSLHFHGMDILLVFLTLVVTTLSDVSTASL